MATIFFIIFLVGMIATPAHMFYIVHLCSKPEENVDDNTQAILDHSGLFIVLMLVTFGCAMLTDITA